MDLKQIAQVGSEDVDVEEVRGPVEPEKEETAGPRDCNAGEDDEGGESGLLA